MNPSGATASTVLETYIQDHLPSNPFAKSNCVLCHVSAKVPGAPSTTPYASDFSFALGEANAPPTSKAGQLRAGPPGSRAKTIRRIFH
jgi:hypothetical protein